MKRALIMKLAVLGAILFAGPAAAQTSVRCAAFNTFPLALNLGQPPLGVGGETNHCLWQKVSDAVNALELRTRNGGSLTGMFGPGTITPQGIYQASYPGVNFRDTVQSMLDVAPGSPQENLGAFAAYMRNRSGGAATPGAGGNAVGFFSTGIISADNSAMWGVNTLMTDNDQRAVAAGGAGRIAVGAELDFNVMRPTTQLIGVSIGGNSLAQPTNANGFLVNTLGNGNKWGTGFWVLDGAAKQGLVIGASEVAGSSKVGIPIWLQAFDSTGTKRTAQIRQEDKYMVFSDLSQGSWGGIVVRQGDLALDAGHGVIVNGQSVLGARVPGWTAGTGTPNLGAFNADYTQTISATYTQSQVQALQNQLQLTQQRVLALETALRTHGLIGP